GWLPLGGGAKSFVAVRRLRAGKRAGAVVGIARLGTDRRAIEPLVRWFPELGWTELKFNWRPEPMSLSSLACTLGAAMRRLLSMARLLDRRYEFFKTLRVIELIAYYKRYL